jgi:hypothetical protein
MVIVLSKLGAAWNGAFGGQGEVEWHTLVLAPSVANLSAVAAGLLQHWFVTLGLAVAVPFLWLGNDLLRRVVGVTCVLAGAATILMFAANNVEFGPFDPVFAVEYAHGLFDMLAGLALLFLPSLRDFFHYQRATRQTRVGSDRSIVAMDDQLRPLPLPVTGGMWGAMVGAAGGFALSRLFAQHYGLGYAIEEVTQGLLNEGVASMLVSILAGSLLGLFVGLVVGMPGPRPEQSLWRFTLTRGLIAAAVCVIGMTLLAGTLAALSGERVGPIFGSPEPGLPTGALVALLALVTMGPPLGIVAFLLGAAVAVLISDPRSHGCA